MRFIGFHCRTCVFRLVIFVILIYLGFMHIKLVSILILVVVCSEHIADCVCNFDLFPAICRNSIGARRQDYAVQEEKDAISFRTRETNFPFYSRKANL